MENSRRQILQAALVAIPALGALKALGADKVPDAKLKVPAGQPTFRLSKNNLGHLTNSLYNSPAERQKFLADPKGYSEGLFKARLDAADTNKLGELQKMFADGFCCGGCGCSMPFGAEVQNLAR
jgi:hypothetical protein